MNRKGFTLLEVVLALSIAAIVLAAAGRIFLRAVDIKTEQDDLSEPIKDAHMLMYHIAAHIGPGRRIYIGGSGNYKYMNIYYPSGYAQYYYRDYGSYTYLSFYRSGARSYILSNNLKDFRVYFRPLRGSRGQKTAMVEVSLEVDYGGGRESKLREYFLMRNYEG